MYFFQDEKRSSDRNSVYSRDASADRSDKYRNQDMSSLPSSPAPPPRPLSSIASGFYIFINRYSNQYLQNMDELVHKLVYI